MNARLLAACAAIVLAAPIARATAQTPFRVLSMDEAITEAIGRNPGLMAQRATLAVADAAVITARLRPNPVLTGDADSLDLLGTGFSALNNAGPPQAAVRVDVPVERGRKRALRSDVAQYGKQLADAQVADALRRLTLDVTVACIDVLEAKAKLQLARDNLQTLERLVDLNERRLGSGAIPPLEVTRSRVAMLQYRASVRTAELALTQARIKLLPLLGARLGDPPVDIDDRLSTAPRASAPNLGDLQTSARAARPDLRAGRTDQARSQADLRLQLAQAKVDYTVGAEVRRQQGIAGRGNMLGIFVSVPLPLFNRNQGEIARAEAEESKARLALAAIEGGVSAEVASAFEEFESSRQLLIEIERDLLQPANDARAGTTYTYQAGATSLLDVLDAQRAFNDTMDNYYAAQAAYRRAQARLTLVASDEAPR
jgi:cobalt-zinc-cadmium efflux system outer membrane protein